MRRIIHKTIIVCVRPYVSRELLGWGRVYNLFVGGWRRDWFWKSAPTYIIKDKMHGYEVDLDLSFYCDREDFFLGRWVCLEHQLLMKEKIKPGDTVIDVGANRGSFALLASRLVGGTGRVICFEPYPKALELLSRQITRNGIKNITVYPFALGAENAEFMQNEETLTIDGTGHKVQVRVGDEVVKDVSPSFIKVDVEGYECNVLKGLSETIKRSNPVILTEVSQRHLQNVGHRVSDLAGALESFGYVGHRLSLTKRKGRYFCSILPNRFDDDPGQPTYDALWLRGRAAA